MIIDIITTVCSVGALLISALAIFFAIKGNNKQLLTNKYEEIYEIILSLSYYYYPLKHLTLLNEIYSNTEKYSEEQRKDTEKEIKIHIEYFEKNGDKEKIDKLTARLELLANSYLKDNELKLQIFTYNDLFKKLILISLRRQIMYKQIFYKNGLPKDNDLMNFIDEISTELVKLMSFGNKSISIEEITKYRNGKFKEKLKI